MTRIKKISSLKKTTIIKNLSISSSSKNGKDKNRGESEVINIEKKIEEKINEAIKKRLGSFVKDMQTLKDKQKKLELLQKNRIARNQQKKNKKRKE